MGDKAEKTCCLTAFYHSTVGKKMIMALTGIVLVGFVIGHMIGNLKVFYPCHPPAPCKIDEYAIFLREIGAHLFGHEVVLWLVRVVLLLSVLLHVDSAIKLSLRNRKSAGRTGEGQRYAVKSFRSATYASRSMSIGGSIIFLFIIIHILHFTTGNLHFAGFEHMHVQANVTRAFQSVGWVILYVVAVSGLGMHLYHGVWSMFQTLGIDSPSTNKVLRTGALVIGVVVSVGFAAVPLAIFLGVIPVQ
jgi:succinate dehydrogenase / fumarate reductase cytochrome b subunit